MEDYPERVSEDPLRRYSQISTRLERLYKVVFATTFWDDLEAQGDDPIAAHLCEIQEAAKCLHAWSPACSPRPVDPGYC
jgi:hypothetical protein